MKNYIKTKILVKKLQFCVDCEAFEQAAEHRNELNRRGINKILLNKMLK